MKQWIRVAAFLILPLISSCAWPKQDAVLEGDATRPYTLLGELELKEPFTYHSYYGLSDSDIMTNPIFKPTVEKLRKRLAHEAKKHGANALIEVRFWPESNPGKISEEYVYARAKMIKYAPFPDEIPAHDLPTFRS